jgi:hypothetical protein
LKVKVKSPEMEQKNWKMTCLYAKGQIAKLNREEPLDSKVKDEHSEQTWPSAVIKLILSRI